MRVRFWLASCLIGLVALGCQPAAQPAPAASQPAAAPPGAAAAAPPPPVKLNAAYVAPTESMSIPWIAKEAGFFARQGLDVELHLVPGSPRLLQSLVAGDFELAQVGTASVMRARLEGLDTTILASSGDYAVFKIMAHPQAGIRTIAELRGRTVAVSQIGSESHTFLKQVLGRQNVSLDDVQVLQAGGNPQAGQAMLSGAINAATVDGTMVPAAERAGAVLLADGSELKIPSPRGITAAMRPWVERNRDVLQRFFHAYVEGVHFYRTQKDDTVRIFQQYMKDLSWDEAAYLWQQGYDGHKPLPIPTDESIQAVIDREFEAQAGQLTPADFYDLSFLREIDRGGLVTRLYQ